MCNHDNMKPYYYGSLRPDIMEQVNEGTMYYGGMRQYSDSPIYFCKDCLEEIYEF